MPDTIEKADLELWLEGDADEEEPCQCTPCGRAATWTVTWSCGCDVRYCLPHFEMVQERDAQRKARIMQMYCWFCGNPDISSMAVRPVRGG